jgi:hypothetical protein
MPQFKIASLNIVAKRKIFASAGKNPDPAHQQLHCYLSYFSYLKKL